MILSLFSRRSKANEAVTVAVYETIVAAARQTWPYGELGVPDTPLGRYEMLSLHVFLFLHRVRSASAPVGMLAQDLTDEFFRDIEHSLREFGIGDMGVPKRVKKLARMFYGRVAAYGEAIDAGDRAALATALARNIRPNDTDWAGAGPLADYVFAAVEALSGQDETDFLAGRLHFPDAPVKSESVKSEGES
jgi:cytochrome b pre-mRNA-processing protein 3